MGANDSQDMANLDQQKFSRGLLNIAIYLRYKLLACLFKIFSIYSQWKIMAPGCG